MRGKNKSLLEDAIIISILLVLIYGIYTLFFSSEEIQQPVAVEDKTTIEQKIETPKEIIKEENTPVKIENKTEDTNLIQENKNIVEKQNNSQNEVVIQEKIIESPKQIETNTEQIVNDEKAKIELFYQNIRGKIDSSIDKSSFKAGEYINIRLTILKDGKQEQLTFMDGNKEYFELIKASIYKTFPIEIPDDLKSNFPRYFRMKIEF